MKKRILSLLLILCMAVTLLPTAVFAKDATGETIPEGGAKIGDKVYATLDKAMEAVSEGATATIYLGKGTYSSYTSTAVQDKHLSLTFIGAGTDKTTWNIGTGTTDANGQGNGDFSFKGNHELVFRDMTLKAGVTPSGDQVTRNYMGFTHTDITVVEDCVIDGFTCYWGYESATFKNTTFNCPMVEKTFLGFSYTEGEYALWTYCSPVMTFVNCTFNSHGKVINVYTDHNAGKYDTTVNFEDCTVNNTSSNKAVLNINDSNMKGCKYILNISGDIKVSGVSYDYKTCSRLFGYSKKANNTGKTIVNFGNTTVWEGGKMVDAKAYHTDGVTVDGVTYDNGVAGSNDSLYAEGYKDNAFDITTSEWTTNADGTVSRTVTKTCKYCGDQEIFTEYQRKLTYDANGGEGAIDSATGVSGESVTVAENGFTRNDYTFTGWNTQADGKGTAYKPGDSFKLTDEDTVLYAQWSKNAPAQVNVSYDANGGTGTMKSITGDVGSKIVIEQNGFARSGYTFTGWNTQADGKGIAYKAGDSFALTDKDTVFYAQWSKNSGSTGTGTNGTAKPTDSPKTGDNSNLALWFVLLLVSGGAAIGTTVVSRKKKYNR